MKKITVNNGAADAITNIAKVEERYKAKFVGQLALKTAGGGWTSDDCGDVYWQPNPPVEGYSNYFAIINRGGSAYITNGASAVEGIITGIVADNSEIIYSRFRHDMRYSTDKSVFIDGGRDYVKCNLGGRTVQLMIVDGEWYEAEDEDLTALTLKGEIK